MVEMTEIYLLNFNIVVYFNVHKEFVDVLSNKKVIRHNMKRIQSKFNRIGTYNVCKISLSYFDVKRDILDDGVDSLAYFHKYIKH